MSPYASLEQQAVQLYESLGHQVERISNPSANVHDLYIRASNAELWLARCYDTATVTDDMFQEFLDIWKRETPQQAAIITNGTFTPAIHAQAQAKGINLVDRAQLQTYLAQAPKLSSSITPPQPTPPISNRPPATQGNTAQEGKPGRKARIIPCSVGAFVIGMLVLVACIGIPAMLGFFIYLAPVPQDSSSQDTTPNSVAATPTASIPATPASSVHEFDFGEAVLVCNGYRVEKGDRWDTVLQWCDTSSWEQISVVPDSVYPGKAIITYDVGNKRLEFAWSGDALILWQAWQYGQ